MSERDHMSSRDAYDAYVATWPEESRWQWWPVPWKLATPREKAVKVALWAGQGIMLAACVVAIVTLEGLLIDNYARMVEMRDRCLKTSTNGFEIEQCSRGVDHGKIIP